MWASDRTETSTEKFRCPVAIDLRQPINTVRAGATRAGRWRRATVAQVFSRPGLGTNDNRQTGCATPASWPTATRFRLPNGDPMTQPCFPHQAALVVAALVCVAQIEPVARAAQAAPLTTASAAALKLAFGISGLAS